MSHPSLDAAPATLQLPPAPASLTGPVKAWSESVAMLACRPPLPDRNPVFTDERHRGVGYPLPVSDGAPIDCVQQQFQALHLENEFLRLMILPELGGRLHFGLVHFGREKLSSTEFLYRPAILRTEPTTGRIPGGLEVNWPLDPRHRAFANTVTHIEEHADGSRTAWCSAYDPLTRLKGMHGFCLYPGRAYIELKVRLFNRTSFSQSFNWSARAAFPSPELTLQPFPESLESAPQGFFGCYCSSSEVGLLQVADQHGSGGQAFHLQPDHGELRGGMYSGLPPSVSTLLPSETKSFSQFWYPFTRIAQVRKANIDAAISCSAGETISVGVAVTRPFPGAAVLLEAAGTVLHRWVKDLAPGRPLLEETTLPSGIDPATISLKVLNSAGRELISYAPEPPSVLVPLPKFEEPQSPRKIETLEALYLAGLGVLHDPHSTHAAEEYFQEALRRDPRHAASNNAAGLLQLNRGEFGEAESHFRSAIATLSTARTSQHDGEFYYNLGLALRYQERDDEAYAAFQRAAWNFGWRASALHAAAELDCKRGNFGVVPKYLYEALRLNADNNNARSLAVVLFRRFGRTAEAEQLVRESLLLDPLDPWACHLAGRSFPGDNQTRLDLAFDYARAGLYEPAIELLTAADTFAQDGSLPMVHYTLAAFYMLNGDFHSAQREYLAAASTHPDFCFPHRLDEMMVLARAIALQPQDARAQYYLGCLLYYYGLPLQAMEIWQSSAKLDPSFATVWRNMARGHYGVTGDHGQALDAFDRAFAADRSDARVLYERDLLWRHLGVPPALRFQEMLEQKTLATHRADTALELATLYNTNGRPEEALALFSSGRLKGWERDSPAVEQYVRTYAKLGRAALSQGEYDRARDLLLLPLSNSAVFHDPSPGAPKACELQFWLGEALQAAGHQAAAQAYWQKSTTLCNTTGAKAAFNESTFYVALSFARIGDRQQSRRLLRELWFAGRRIAREKAVTPATTLSSLQRDESKKQHLRGLLMQSQARVGLGQYKLAARLLEQLLKLDPNNGRALDLISDVEHATTAK